MCRDDMDILRWGTCMLLRVLFTEGRRCNKNSCEGRMYVDSPSAVGQRMTESRSGEVGGLRLYCETRGRMNRPSGGDGALGILVQVLVAISFGSSEVGPTLGTVASSKSSVLIRDKEFLLLYVSLGGSRRVRVCRSLEVC